MTSFLWAWKMTKNSTFLSILQSRNPGTTLTMLYPLQSYPRISCKIKFRPPASSISRYRLRHPTIEAGSTQVSGEEVCSHLFPKKDLGNEVGSRTFCSLALSPLAYKSLTLHVLAHPSDPWSICRLPLAIISRNLWDFMKAATRSIKLLRHLFLYIPSLLCFHQKGLVIAPRIRSCLHLRLRSPNFHGENND